MNDAAPHNGSGPETPYEAPDQEFVNMLWKWFEDRGVDLGPERSEGLTAEDFRIMLDEHEIAMDTSAATPEGPSPAQARDHLAEQCAALLRENERLRAALKPFADAMTVAERELPHDQHERLTYCREQLTLYEFHNARCAHQQTETDSK